ncbi:MULTISPECIES: hypothetical protein [Kitasatospora]|uniref:Uncharacterized protein n=1 Tax=Kitasatospora setae (strain ATCC 33774 / DSM 43861 / JCM 3304 / KCC A-0304 / NBRC 14216 / KM-6054) TaxID=452652 RepID=E4NA33_KITSK|nr:MULTISPECIES: hypothetical protein [Kitasatospora]BAJ28064.1 hypothetical protein KSE_22430 [Kitasatospora setae KM-6054]
MSQLSAEDELERVIDAVVGPAGEAYYSDRVRSGSAARVRAQAAQSTITLFAGGLVATLTFTALADRPVITQVSGIVAVSLWMVAAVMYLRAVALPVPALAWGGGVTSRLNLIEMVLEKADQEAAHVDRRQRGANAIAVLALIASAITVALGVLVGPAENSANGTVAVSQSYNNVLQELCGLSGNKVSGRIDISSLNSQFIKVEVSIGHCADGSTTLRIPKSEVTAISMDNDD